MAHTKQMSRNPNMDRPTIAMGSDVQPEKKPFETNIKEIIHERRETTLKAFTT